MVYQGALTGWLKLVADASQSARRVEDVEALLGDIPDEFLDPLLSTLMKDPVQLPSSGVIIDRPTIERHLLTDQHDPFNRQPLTADKLVPRPDIKQKIEAFVSAKLSAQK